MEEFASTDEILAAASVPITMQSSSEDLVAAWPDENMITNSATTRHTRQLSYTAIQVPEYEATFPGRDCLTLHGEGNEYIDVTLCGLDCNVAQPGDQMERSRCFWPNRDADEYIGLKAGNTYSIYWTFHTEDYDNPLDVKIKIYEHDTGGRDDDCGFLARAIRSARWSTDVSPWTIAELEARGLHSCRRWLLLEHALAVA